MNFKTFAKNNSIFVCFFLIAIFGMLILEAANIALDLFPDKDGAGFIGAIVFSLILFGAFLIERAKI